MITYPKDGEQNPEATSSKLPKGKKKEREVLMITIDQDNSEVASSKQPQRRIRTKSVMKEERQFQKQDQIFTTNKRKPMKYQQARNKSALEEDDESQQKQYEYIETLGSQEENIAGEIGEVHEEKNIQETDEVIKQTKKSISSWISKKKKRKSIQLMKY